jgi:pSer/pThr/pTyr-binding forkhead associated (FHA) protein
LVGESVQRVAVLASAALPRGFFLLSPQEVITIGRVRENRIVLGADEVSRRHAQIAPDGIGGFVISDLQSSNGVLVNGVLLTKPCKLRDDDLIGIGPFHLQFLLVVGGTPDELARRFDPKTKQTSAGKVIKTKEAQLSGTISGTAFLETCQLLETSQRSGVLRVEMAGIHGHVKFAAGLIVDARNGPDVSEKAVRQILGLKNGRYAFEETPAGSPPPTGMLKLRVGVIALDVLRVRDEQSMRPSGMRKTQSFSTGLTPTEPLPLLPPQTPPPPPPPPSSQSSPGTTTRKTTRAEFVEHYLDDDTPPPLEKT